MHLFRYMLLHVEILYLDFWQTHHKFLDFRNWNIHHLTTEDIENVYNSDDEEDIDDISDGDIWKEGGPMYR